MHYGVASCQKEVENDTPSQCGFLGCRLTLPTCLPILTYLAAYPSLTRSNVQCTYLPTYLPTCLPARLRTYLYLPSYLSI